MVTSIHVAFEVDDYEKWKRAFDAHLNARKEAGELSYKVYRDAENPNTVTVLTEQEDPAKLKAFLESPDLVEAMEGAGITRMGEMLTLDEVDNG
jgi:quinol monooxygenase YgiN